MPSLVQSKLGDSGNDMNESCVTGLWALTSPELAFDHTCKADVIKD